MLNVLLFVCGIILLDALFSTFSNVLLCFLFSLSEENFWVFFLWFFKKWIMKITLKVGTSSGLLLERGKLRRKGFPSTSGVMSWLRVDGNLSLSYIPVSHYSRILSFLFLFPYFLWFTLFAFALLWHFLSGKSFQDVRGVTLCLLKAVKRQLGISRPSCLLYAGFSSQQGSPLWEKSLGVVFGGWIVLADI